MYKYAGLITFEVGKYTVHILPSYKFWYIGYSKSWYDGFWYQFGFGPFLLICWYD